MNKNYSTANIRRTRIPAVAAKSDAAYLTIETEDMDVPGVYRGQKRTIASVDGTDLVDNGMTGNT